MAVIHRENEGYDFASYKLVYRPIGEAIHSTPLPESLILMNDSCLGPFGDLQGITDKMIASHDAVFGITKSYEIAAHLQSYFYHFGRDRAVSGNRAYSLATD
jgi:lipopolysaccharide biosynthesis protein